MKVLLIDDSEELGLLVKHGLKPYFVHQVFSITQAEKCLQELEYDLLLIDVSLPDGDGFEFCSRLNKDLRFEKTPRIMLTARAEEAEKVYGFSCGADDYVTKPFSSMELKARIDRHLQRRYNTAEGIQVYGKFMFNLEFQRCSVIEDEGQKDLGLTPTEFRVFLNLAKNEGRVLSRKFLEMAGWEAVGTNIEARGIDTHIAHLRKKLGDFKNVIVSVYGQGYSFSLGKEDASAKAA